MARKKVEICGVNTSSLPLLSEEEKEDLFERIEQINLLFLLQKVKGEKIYLSGSSKVIFLPENIISKEIYDLFSVSSNDFQEVMKMQMIFFKLAASVL